MPPTVLISEPDPALRGAVVRICGERGMATVEAEPGPALADALATCQPEVLVLGLDSADLSQLHTLTTRHPSTVCVGLSEPNDVQGAVRGLHAGLSDVIEHSRVEDLLDDALERALENRHSPFNGDPTPAAAMAEGSPFVGRSSAMARVLELVGRMASTPRSTVLVTGESGVGKELLARAVHDRSARAEHPFIALNCAALSESLVEAELFGYEAGAFTGGLPKGREGLIAAAEGGTLFLDEIGELAAPLQAKLLRVLQERTYRKVGGHQDRLMDVRIVAATNRDLVSMVEEGTFREDLYYRLNVLSIQVPPLRERPEDIVPLATQFLSEFACDLGRRLTGFSDAALASLADHAWPGNVRELRNVVERATILAQEGLIRSEHLALAAPSSNGTPHALGSSSAAAHAGRLPLESLNLRQVEESVIRQALEQCAGNRSQAARELGINRTTLYNKLRLYEISA